MFERYRQLSHALLRYATRGLQSKDFLAKASEKITQSSGADVTELWVKEDLHKHFRCSFTSSSKRRFRFKSVSCRLGETVSPAPNDKVDQGMERLCCNVIRGQLEALKPHVTERGSFWTNEASSVMISGTHLIDEPPPSDVHRSHSFQSLALIPIRIEQECIGLLQLKSRRVGFFGINDLSFFEDISEVLGVALSHQYAQIELRERVKELTCLSGIAQVIGRGASINEVLQGIAELLPPAWLHPDIACARIVIDGHTYASAGFQETAFRQSSDVIVDKQKVGFVEVAYLENKMDMDEGPFLAEERSLINSVAREVAIFYQRTRADAEKASLHDQLRHADRLATIGQLAAGVAHELNEPLGNILGFAQLAKKTPDLQPQVAKDLQSIETASLHAREIIRKLMTFSRQLPPRKAPADLNDLVNDGLYYFQARCVKAGIVLILDLADELPVVTMDAGQMNQVLVNLVVNAIQAMPDGGTLRVRTRTAKGGILLSVEDTGTGMNEELKNQIFLPFFTTKDVNEGTGLGLAVVHGIVNAHGGSIEVNTEENRGTEFHIFLPSEHADEAYPGS